MLDVFGLHYAHRMRERSRARQCQRAPSAVRLDSEGLPQNELATTRYQRMRRAYLLANPLCKICLAVGRVTLAVELDHIKRRVDKGSVWSHSNLQGLCRECHIVKSIAERGDRLKPRIGLDGYPLPERTHDRVTLGNGNVMLEAQRQKR